MENILYCDVETIPDQAPGTYERILSELSPPKKMTKADTIAHWWKTQAKEAAEKAYHDTGKDGTTGELLSIAWAFNQQDIQCVIRTLYQPETMLLDQFFDAMEEANTDYLKFCAHNAKFDLSFLWKRSVILKRRPPVALHTGRHSDVIDTMEMWAGYNQYIKFDALCHVLGLEGKTGMDGSMVWDYAKQGRFDEIRVYNIDDVNQLRQCYRRMKFLDWVPEDPKDEITISNEEDKKLNESGFFDKVMGDV